MAFRIIREDITKVLAEVIVNPANPEPLIGGGTDSAIYEAAGKEQLLAERELIGPIAPGEVAVTRSYGLRKNGVRYILHAVTSFYEDGKKGEDEILRSAYQKSLQQALRLGCASIAFPLLGTGTYGYPKGEALGLAASVFGEFLMDHEMEILLVVFGEEAFRLSEKLFPGVSSFIDNHYVEQTIRQEYGHPYPAAEQDARRRRWNMAQSAMACEEASEDMQGMWLKDAPGPVPDSAPRPKASYGSATPGSALPREKYAPKKEKRRAEKLVSGASAPAGMAKRSLDQVIAEVDDTFQEQLFRLIDQKGLDERDVYKRANLDRRLFSRIRSNKNYQPKKQTAIALALALELNLDETKDLLGRAGFTLSGSSRADLIVQYFIENGIYDVITVNITLFEYGEMQLGA